GAVRYPRRRPPPRDDLAARRWLTAWPVRGITPFRPPMHCPSCGHDLRPGARFCDACGHPVGGVAPSERRPHAPAHLAEKILASRGRLEGERKQVTVLFADVKGSMELAERVDPEAWHRILDRFFAILADGVHRFEGTV